MSKFQVYIEAEDGDNPVYDIEADDYATAITIAMDKAFEEYPDRKFRPGGYQEVEL